METIISVNGKKKKIEFEPKKINDYTYIIEKQEGMNVPVKIFANEKLMEQMRNDISLSQGINVACLPGIKKFSYIYTTIIITVYTSFPCVFHFKC